MNLLTLTQAVGATGIHESTIRRQLRKGHLEGVKKDGAWLISEVDLFDHYPARENGEAIDTHEIVGTKDTTVMELKEAIADLRKDRDAWREIAMRAN